MRAVIFYRSKKLLPIKFVLAQHANGLSLNGRGYEANLYPGLPAVRQGVPGAEQDHLAVKNIVFVPTG